MKNDNKRTFTKENALRNGTRTQDQWSKNQISQTIEEPGKNDSYIEAKKRGF